MNTLMRASGDGSPPTHRMAQDARAMTRRSLRCASVSAWVLVCLCASCAREPPAARLTVEGYRADALAREAMLRECANNPGELRDTPECINAREAARIEGIGSLRDLPPMGLPDASAADALPRPAP